MWSFIPWKASVYVDSIITRYLTTVLHAKACTGCTHIITWAPFDSTCLWCYVHYFSVVEEAFFKSIRNIAYFINKCLLLASDVCTCHHTLGQSAWLWCCITVYLTKGNVYMQHHTKNKNMRLLFSIGEIAWKKCWQVTLKISAIVPQWFNLKLLLLPVSKFF